MLDEEAWSEVAADDFWGEVRQGPTAGGAGGDRFQHGVQVESRALGVEERLADADHVHADERLIGELGPLAGTGAAVANPFRAEGFPEGFEEANGLLGAADH